MSNTQPNKVITANHLLNGNVVYLNSQFDWVNNLSDAKVFTDETSIEEAIINANSQQHEVVGVYSINIAVLNEIITPKHFREQFRTKGTSNYNHGQQSEVSVCIFIQSLMMLLLKQEIPNFAIKLKDGLMEI